MARSALIRTLVRSARDDRGVAAIEAAIAFPFLVALGAGLFEFGTVFYNVELMQTGVRDAARYLARTEEPTAAEAAARNLAVTGAVTAGQPLRVSWWQPQQVRITYRDTPNPIDPATGLRRYRGADPLKVIRVSTDVPYAGQGLLALIRLGPLQVGAAHEERYVGQ